MTVLQGKALLDHGERIARRYRGQVGADVADDLRDEAVLRALAHPAPDGRVEPWLERIYRNLVVDDWRHTRHIAVGDDASEGATTATPEDAVLLRERRRLVRRNLGRLPREARRALLSRFYQESDDASVAERLGVSATTVRTRIHRALARLRTELAHLRAWLPPFVAKLGSEAGVLALTQGLAIALAVAPLVAPKPSPEASSAPARLTVSEPIARAVAAVASDLAVTAVPSEAPRPMAKRSTVPSRLVGRPSARPPIAKPNAVAPVEQPVAIVLQPDGLYVVAEPPSSLSPCMVEAPADLTPQIEKMIEDQSW